MSGSTSKVRLDLLLVERQLAASRETAQRLVLAGAVRSGDRVLDKPGVKVAADIPLQVIGPPCRYVSMGGLKLEAALQAFNIHPAGWRCLDVGASTGGFTDCLLQAGAGTVVAVDVGYGQLAWSLRSDPRVTVIERANFRQLPIERLGEPFRLAVIDVSFISLRLILPRVVEALQPDGEILSLIKPQFEAGRDAVGRGGLVRDPAVHLRVIEDLAATASAWGIALWQVVAVPLVDVAKNLEFVGHWRQEPPPTAPDCGAVVLAAHTAWRHAANPAG